MGNSVILAGSGETDGGLTVTMSIELDSAVLLHWNWNWTHLIIKCQYLILVQTL